MSSGYISAIPSMLLMGFYKGSIISSFNINLNTYLTQLQEGKKGTVLLIKGGLDHYTESNYITKYMTLELQDYNVYMLVKNTPVLGRDIGKDVYDCLRYLRRKHSGFLCVSGFSMGGVAVLAYLSYGYNIADYNVVACSTLNFDRLEDMSIGDFFVRYIQNDSLERLGYTNLENALLSIGKTEDELRKELRDIEIGLRIHKEWRNNTLYVVGEKDQITKVLIWPYNTDVDYVENGGHCDHHIFKKVSSMIKNYYMEV